MATYSNRFTKFGNKTENEIAVLSSTYTLEVGDNVYNTTINKEEYWTGNHWINDDCVEVTASTAVNLGNVVSIDPDNLSATSAICELSLSTRDDWQIGVIYRGGSANTKVLVALKGYYKVKFTAATTTTTRQHIAQLTTTSGEVNSTASKVGGSSSIGVIAETYASVPADKLVYCWINSSEAF